MDIMELGAVGELVGGVAVSGALIYLAVEVRENTLGETVAAHPALAKQWNRTA